MRNSTDVGPSCSIKDSSFHQQIDAIKKTLTSAALYLPRSPLSCRINTLLRTTRLGGLAVTEYFAIYFAVFTVLALTLIH